MTSIRIICKWQATNQLAKNASQRKKKKLQTMKGRLRIVEWRAIES